jgi:deoxycytidylate deaminase
MNISNRLIAMASRMSGQSPEALKSQVKQTEHLSTDSETDFADLMADRSQVVAYEYTDPIRSMVRANPRHAAALNQLYSHTDTSRSEGFTLAREIEGDLGAKRGVFSVHEEQNGLIELAYRQGNEFTGVFIDTTPGQAGEQYLIADLTPMYTTAFGG